MVGIYEAHCQICGISFNIARIRRPDEPRSAAWSCDGNDTYLDRASAEECGPGSGCQLTDRRNPGDSFMSLRDVCDIDSEGEQDEEFLTLDNIEFEHIAGPGCKTTEGYSGYRITLEEMRNCQVVQCMVRKDYSFSPAADDENFEKDLNGEWFLSGLTDFIRPEGGLLQTSVPRHGTYSLEPMNQNWGDEMPLRACMPFHPARLEVWKRVSVLCTGQIDVQGLMGWYEMGSVENLFHHVLETRRLEEIQEPGWDGESWVHKVGTEYLAANPLFVPGLSGVLKSAVSYDATFVAENGEFDIDAHTMVVSSLDPFGDITPELRLSILENLFSKDIANLRLASRAFRQLPISLWHSLIIKEMPWLWEAWGNTTPYSFWATVSENQLKKNLTFVKRDVPVPDTLPHTQTNWHRLYLAIKRQRGSLKGLQNRERIWKECQVIRRRMDVC